MTCTGPGSDSKKAAPGIAAVAGGRMAVLMNPQSGSLQPGMIDAIAGEADVVPPVVVVVLLAPVLVTTPEPVEFVMLPMLVPTNPPTVLLALLVTAPEAVESAMLPMLAPTKPPTVLLAPVLVTA